MTVSRDDFVLICALCNKIFILATKAQRYKKSFVSLCLGGKYVWSRIIRVGSYPWYSTNLVKMSITGATVSFKNGTPEKRSAMTKARMM